MKICCPIYTLIPYIWCELHRSLQGLYSSICCGIFHVHVLVTQRILVCQLIQVTRHRASKWPDARPTTTDWGEEGESYCPNLHLNQQLWVQWLHDLTLPSPLVIMWDMVVRLRVDGSLQAVVICTDRPICDTEAFSGLIVWLQKQRLTAWFIE